MLNQNADAPEKSMYHHKKSCQAPQESLLGLLLFTFFINDLNNSFHDNYDTMFADDAAVVAETNYFN